MSRRAFGSVRKLPSGRWQARYTGPDLAEHKAPNTFAFKKDAESWLGAEDRLIASGGWTAPVRRQAAAGTAAVTVAEYVERVIQRRATRSRKPLAPTTADLYRKDFRLEIEEPLGGVALVGLTPAKIAAWVDAPTKAPTQKGRAYDLLKSVLNDAVEEELIARNPCRVKGAGKPTPMRRGEALSVDQVLTYLEAVPERYRVALMVSAWCALRSGEVRGLRRSDVDMTAQTFSVVQAVSRVRTGPTAKSLEWRVAGPKTAAGVRTVTMPAVMVEPMRNWIAQLPMAGRDGWLFPSVTDLRKPIQSSVLHEAHAKGRNAIGMPDLTVHDLRRTAATLAAQGGATTAELMRLLGHTTAAMAMVYQRATDARDLERARRLDAQIINARKGA
jgi:integrase